jgi:hypothetical protein
MMIKLLLLTLLLIAAPLSRAEGFAISLHTGSNFRGIDLATSLSERLDLRLGYSTSESQDFTLKDTKRYTETYNSREESALLLDFHPGDSGFRISFGVVHYQAKHKLSRTSSIEQQVTFTKRDTSQWGYQLLRCIFTAKYPCDDIISETTTSTTLADFGTHSYDVGYKVYAPYLGIGYATQARKSGGLGFTADFGAFYRNAPDITTTFSCGPSNPPGTPTCDAYQNAISEETTAMKDNYSKWMPKVSVGIQYVF